MDSTDVTPLVYFSGLRKVTLVVRQSYKAKYFVIYHGIFLWFVHKEGLGMLIKPKKF